MKTSTIILAGLGVALVGGAVYLATRPAAEDQCAAFDKLDPRAGLACRLLSSELGKVVGEKLGSAATGLGAAISSAPGNFLGFVPIVGQRNNTHNKCGYSADKDCFKGQHKCPPGGRKPDGKPCYYDHRTGDPV